MTVLLRRALIIGVVLSAAGVGVAAEPSPVVGGGYVSPTHLKVAPGQVVTVFVPGVATGIEGPIHASGPTLPNELAGIAVTLHQSRGTSPLPVPMFAIEPWETCSAGLFLACTSERLAAITVQIPFELSTNDPGGTVIGGSEAMLVVSEAGVESAGFRVIPAIDQIHVLNSCDTAIPFGYLGSPCEPVVTHGDGSRVSPSSPARGNEVLVLYAFGLGRPVGDVSTGSPAPAPIAIEGLRVRFDFGVSLEPSVPPPDGAPTPEYAGLVQGLIGLYQINVRIPEIPIDTPPCTGAVASNLAISVGGPWSFDGARVCVEP